MSRPQVRPGVRDMPGYHSPQVDVRVRLNTNESPFGPPAPFAEALARRLADIDWNRYPPRAAGALRAGIAEVHGVTPEQVFAANGSNEVIQSLLLAYAAGGGRVGVFTPSYALHSHIARVVGAEVVTAPRDDDFRVSPQAVERFVTAERPAVLFLCSPNNPTGTTETPATIRAALAAMAETGGLLVVDEAYIPFVDSPAAGNADTEVDTAGGAGDGASGDRRAGSGDDAKPTTVDARSTDPTTGETADGAAAETTDGTGGDSGSGTSGGTSSDSADGTGEDAAGDIGGSATAHLGEEVPLVVCRTFSKAWSLAAARLGYALAPSWLVAELEKVVLPYHLDAMTQEAGLLALRHRTQMEQQAEAVVAERRRLVAGLAQLPVQQWPSGANFILFRPLKRPGAQVWQELLDRSVLVRDCSSWEGLDGCLRVTVGTPEENAVFLAALADILR